MLNITYLKNYGATTIKIRIISHREDISCLLPNEKIVHIAFRPSNEDIFKICEACPKIEAVQLPISYKRTLSKSVMMFLSMQKIAILEGDVWGHRRDLCEYRAVPQGAYDEIEAMKKKKASVEKIVHDVGAKYRLSSSLVEFVIKKGATT